MQRVFPKSGIVLHQFNLIRCVDAVFLTNV